MKQKLAVSAPPRPPSPVWGEKAFIKTASDKRFVLRDDGSLDAKFAYNVMMGDKAVLTLRAYRSKQTMRNTAYTLRDSTGEEFSRAPSFKIDYAGGDLRVGVGGHKIVDGYYFPTSRKLLICTGMVISLQRKLTAESPNSAAPSVIIECHRKERKSLKSPKASGADKPVSASEPAPMEVDGDDESEYVFAACCYCTVLLSFFIYNILICWVLFSSDASDEDEGDEAETIEPAGTQETVQLNANVDHMDVDGNDAKEVKAVETAYELPLTFCLASTRLYTADISERAGCLSVYDPALLRHLSWAPLL